MARRARIVLLAAEGLIDPHIAPQVGLSRDTIFNWRTRWNKQAAQLAADPESPTNTVSVDEKTGMQALERSAPDLPVRPGYCAKREYEYVRHGTLAKPFRCTFTGTLLKK